ncbi:hypothetical protein V3C99_006249 [Haemonchus contortus]
MLLLILVLLLHLLAEGSSQYVPNVPISEKEQSEYIVNLINEMRAKVANGDISTSYGPLPSSLHMFQLEYSPELEVYTKINTLQCQNENFTPSGSSMNYYTLYETPSDNLDNITVINLALASWMEEILNTNFGSQVTYTNQNMQDFANMMYYKSTKAGCAYQKCNQPAPPRAVVACIFNSAPETGKPIYLGTAGVTGCNNDGDCSSVLNGTKCGPQGLCGYSFTTTTKVHSTASTAPVTTPATEIATSGAATGTPSKAATASTKGTGTPSEASSASTQGTGTSSKAATASTKGTGTPSKAASASTKGTGASSKAATVSTQGTGTPSKAASASTQGTGASSKAASASTQGTEASSKAATASTEGTGTPSKAASASTKGIEASSKVATASTKGTGTPSKAASASTKGTGASSKAATASTQGTGTPSKAASASTQGTGASSKAATAFTQGTGASLKAATAFTQGTGTPSKAASASTQGTGASSKAASTSTRGTTTPSAASTSISEKTTAAATTTQTVLTTTAAAKLNQSELFIELINGYREKVAKGDLSTSSGSLPSSLQMFQVEYSPELEVYAKINTIQCQPENFTPPGSSMSYYTYYETPGNNPSNITLINLALAYWMDEMLNTNFGSQVTYTNQNIQDFANMIYYKSTKAGCAYQQCNQIAPPRVVVACIFNSAPQLGKPIYPGTEGVNGCNKDSSCSAVFSGTTCGPQGLCGYSFS